MNLREIRKQRNITQEQLARMSGIRQVHISSLELGKIKNPAWYVVANLARALEVAPEELFPVPQDTPAA